MAEAQTREYKVKAPRSRSGYAGLTVSCTITRDGHELFSGSLVPYQRRSCPPLARPHPRPPPPDAERPPPNAERRPPDRSACGLASLTVRARPCRSYPLKRSLAACASRSFAISTKPNPRDCPVNLSVMTCAEATVPAWLNNSSRSSLVALKERLPTNNFVATTNLQKKGPGNHEYGSRGLYSLEPTHCHKRTEQVTNRYYQRPMLKTSWGTAVFHSQLCAVRDKTDQSVGARSRILRCSCRGERRNHLHPRLYSTVLLAKPLEAHKRAFLQLTHPLPGHAETRANLLQGEDTVSTQAKA